MIGVTKTYVDRISAVSPAVSRTYGTHVFIRLRQPLTLPTPHMLSAKTTYEFPFTFVIPKAGLPASCPHPKSNRFVQDSHTQLPPSLGDPSISGTGACLLDDMAPEMARIDYVIEASVLRQTEDPESTRLSMVSLLHGVKKLRILPKVEEEPPLLAMENGRDDDGYVLRREIEMKKGLSIPFRKKKTSSGGGKLIFEATQPRSFHLPNSASSSSTTPSEAPSTLVKINVRFEPSDPSQEPPRLGTLKSKMQVLTFFATQPRRDLARRSETTSIQGVNGVYNTSVSLEGGDRNVGNLQWTRHEPGSGTTIDNENITRRNSSTVSGALAHPDLPHYTTTLLAPLSLPTNSKSFVPTFHTCLVSRIYYLDLSLTFQSGSSSSSKTSSSSSSSSKGKVTGLFAPSTSLRIPIQISSEGSTNATPSASSSSENESALPPAFTSIAPTSTNNNIAAQNRASALFLSSADFDTENGSAFFEPRLISPPASQYTETAQLHRSSVSTRSASSSGSSARLSSDEERGVSRGAPPGYVESARDSRGRERNRMSVSTADTEVSCVAGGGEK